MNRQLSRSIIAAGACIGAGIALQPIYAEPSLHALAVQSGEMILRSGSTIVVTLAAAYAIHRIKSWATERPVMPTPSQVYAITKDYGPNLSGEVARAECAERTAEPDDAEHQTRQAVIRFCINGEWYGSFAYQAMKHHCDRPTWDRLKDYLSREKVLRMGSGTRPTWFMEGWNSVKVRVALHRGDIPLPDNPKEVPVVVWADYRHAMHASKQASTQAYWKG